MSFMVSFIRVLTSKNSGFMQFNSANNRHPLWACSIYVKSRNGRDLLQNLCKTYLQCLYLSERALMCILLKLMIILNAIKLNLWKNLITERVTNKIHRWNTSFSFKMIEYDIFLEIEVGWINESLFYKIINIEIGLFHFLFFTSWWRLFHSALWEFLPFKLRQV